MSMRFAAVSAGALFLSAGLAQAQVTESFEDVLSLPGMGWTMQNASEFQGLTDWFQGNPDVFHGFSGGYIGANYNNTSGTGTISNWLVAPVTTLTNGDQIHFYLRVPDGTAWGDRVQVRLSDQGAASVVPTLGNPTDVGTFTNLLLDINPSYDPNGIPQSWTLYSATVSGLAGPTQVRVAFRYFVEFGGPSGSNSDYIGIDEVVIGGAPPSTGACCLPSGLCVISTSAGCTGQGGTYQGDNTACGSCPLPAGTWVEVGEAGELPGSAQITQGTGPLNVIVGANGIADDTDMYKIKIVNPAAFSATTVNGATFDTQLWLFNSEGHGIVFNDDDLATNEVQSTLTNEYVASLPPGEYYLAITQYDHWATAGGQDIFPWQPFTAQLPPLLPGVPVDGWAGSTSPAGTYQIFLTGVEFAQSGGPACYANCDGSTAMPVLNVADFSCFLTKFAQGDGYANCDGSTATPVLNVADFSCFLTKFAQGCP